MVETGLAGAPVADPVTRRPNGVIGASDLLRARLHDLTEEHHRERVLPRGADAGPAPATPEAVPTGAATG